MEFTEKHKFVLANTLYNHKNSRRTTLHAPNGRTDNQIDYILTPQRFKSSIITTSTRTYPGADIGSDHDLVLCNLKLKSCIRKRAITNRIRFDLDKLENATTVNDYKVKLDLELSQVKINENYITETCNMVEKAILLTAEKTIGKYRKKKQPWITHNILDLCDDRRKLKALTKVKPVKPELKDKYRQINIRIRNLMKEAKETWIQSQCTSINVDMAKGRVNKKAYQTLKILTKTTRRKTMIILDKDNKPITENIELIKTWTEYCKDLYNFKIKPDNNLLKPNIMNNNEESLPIFESEVRNAIRTLKNGKSPGPDNIPGELLKHGGESLIKIFTIICQQIWKTKKWPDQWTKSLIIPIPKKGDSRKCSNYRTLLQAKILLRIILNRLNPQAETILAEEQAGFRKSRSTIEQILNCRIHMEKHIENNKDVYHNFIDFKKAFDRVWHKGLWQSMYNFGISQDIIETIESLYSSSTSAVLINNVTGSFFNTTVGVRQGCLLSPVLFNIFLEQIMINTLDEYTSTISIGGRKISNLRFADDIDLIAGSNTELQDLTCRIFKSPRHGNKPREEQNDGKFKE